MTTVSFVNVLNAEPGGHSPLVLSEATGGNDDDAKSHYKQGLSYLSERNFDRAIVEFSDAIRLDPDFSLAVKRRGLAYKATGNLDLAIADFTRAIEIKPNDASAYISRASANEANGDVAQAILDYGQAIQLAPDNPVAHFERGYLHQSENRHDQAIADYSEALRLNPESVQFRRCRGKAHQAKGNLDLAIKDFTECIRLNRSDVNYFNRGYAHELSGDTRLAHADYKMAARIMENVTSHEPNNGKAWLRWGNYLHVSGDLTQAIEKYEKAAGFEDFAALARYNLACAHALLGDIDQAFLELDLAVESGYANIQQIECANDLRAIRNDSRFEKLIERIRQVNSQR